MVGLEQALRNYVEVCGSIFKTHHSKLGNVVALPTSRRSALDTVPFLATAIEEAESTAEFESLVQCLESSVLSKDLERLQKREEAYLRNRQGTSRNKKKIAESIRQWRSSTLRFAAHRCFVNTGAYVTLWQTSRIEELSLLDMLQHGSEPSDYLRLVVFDGFALYDAGKKLRHIALPVGELKAFDPKQLKGLLRLPQSAWLDRVPSDLAEQLSGHYILVVKQREHYRGRSGLWLNERMVSGLSFIDLDDLPRESDIDLFGPLFLCLGENANLAEELRLRTNVFDGLPCNRLTRNGYLPWDRIDNEGNPYPRSTVVQVGNDGEQLKTIYEAWMAVNNLSNDGFLRTPTQTFAGAIMDLHKAEYRQVHLRVPFLGLITSFESVLVADSHTDLAYKTALRGSALLTHRPEERWKAFRILNRFYTIRSKIVHSGSPGDVGLDELIHVGLLEMSQQILLRYIFLIYQGLRGLLPSWVIPSKDVFASRGKRPQAISKVLDIAVLDPKLIIKLEKFLDKHGLLEKNLWKNRHVLDILLPEKK